MADTLKRTRIQFTEAQTDHMKKMITDGVIKRVTLKEMPVIEATAVELNLDALKVKKFFQNRLLGKTQPFKPGTRLTTRQSSNFNAFCSQTKLEVKGWKQKMDLWKSMWAGLSDDEKKSYKPGDEAPIDSLTPKQLANRVNKRFQVIKQECSALQRMGCELVMFGLHNGNTMMIGSDNGGEWLKQNPQIIDEFRVFLAMKSIHQPTQPESSTKIVDRVELEEEVRKMMDKKYSEVVTCRSKFQYKAVNRGDVEVTGIPVECQPLLPPSRYTPYKLKLLLDAEANITVKIIKPRVRKPKNIPADESDTNADATNINTDVPPAEDPVADVPPENSAEDPVADLPTPSNKKRGRSSIAADSQTPNAFDLPAPSNKKFKETMTYEDATQALTLELNKTVEKRDRALLAKLFRLTLKERRQKIATVDDGQVNSILKEFPLLNNIFFVRMEFECLLTVRAECQSQNWADIMRKLGAMLGEDSEIHLLVQLMTNLEAKMTKAKNMKPVLSISKAEDLDLTSESRSPPRLVLVEHGDEASATGDWEAYILADNVAVRCRKGSLQSVVTDLLAVYYAWDLTFPTQYQLLGFLQMYLLNDVTEAKAFKKSKRFLKVEQQYLAI